MTTTTETETERATFIGPLPEGLIREHWAFPDGVTLAYWHHTPREFALAAAALMRHRGREVKVTETADSVWVYAIAPRWFDTTVFVHVCKPGQRWKFMSCEASGKSRAKSQRDARGIVDLYGTL